MYKKLLLALSLVFLFGRHNAQNHGEIDLIDQYFELWKTQDTALTALFTQAASISVINYDSNGASSIKRFRINEYLSELRKTSQEFELWQEPVVLIKRSYGHASSFYCSVVSHYESRKSQNSITFRSIQSMKLLYVGNQWKIDHILVQFGRLNDYNFDQSLWSDTLPQELNKKFNKKYLDNSISEYNTDKIYQTNEVDVVPITADSKEEYEKIKSRFNISESNESADSVGTPFLVLISEDGTPTLYYVNDLNDEQIKMAQEFTQSMLPWYPAIKNKASVKCKLKFYIR